MSSQPKTSPLIVVILAILVIGSSWWGINALSRAKAEEGPSGSTPGGPPPANVILATVESKASTQTHQVVGTLRAKSRAKIAAREAGAAVAILGRALIEQQFELTKALAEERDPC